MKRKIILIIFVFLFNIVWVNAISITNKLSSQYNFVIKTSNSSSNNSNNTTIIEDIDIMLEGNLTFKDEDASIIGKKIDNYLKNELLGNGELIARYSIVNNMDPYLMAAILVEETGCDTSCNIVVKKCNNVYKALYNNSNINETSCFGGSYKKFNTKEESIKSFIKYMKTNFYDKELTTTNTIYKEYKKDVRWVFRVNEYINKIKNSSIGS